MKETIISLGGGCDIATILDTYGLRSQSLPFDWLWNLDTGLSDVTKIIASDFSGLRDRDSYAYTSHYKWQEADSLVFRDYPRIAHIHTNPLKNDYQRETYNRRINKFIQLMEDDLAPITFMYYRLHHEGVEAQSNDIIQQRLAHLFEESNQFMAMMDAKYPNRNFKLISLFEALEEGVTEGLLHNQFNELVAKQTRSDIYFEFITPRPETDDQLRKKWSKNWLAILQKYKLISWQDQLLVRPRKIRKKLRRHYLKYSQKR
ncbi:MAG: DUF1796 family putative cysteine peptidase [Pontiella sp.]